MKERRYNEVLSFWINEEEAYLLNELMRRLGATSRGEVVRLAISHLLADKNYINELSKDVKELDKLRKEQFKQRIKDEKHELIVNKGKFVLRKNLFLDYIKNYYVTNIVTKNISEKRKTEIVNSFIEMGLFYGYTKKEVLGALKKAGYKASIKVKGD